MDCFSPPSFSLGLDFDLDIADVSTEGEEEEEEGDDSPIQPNPDQWKNEGDILRESLNQESEYIDEQQTLFDVQSDDSSPCVFKRLRRGLPLPAGENISPLVDRSVLVHESSQLGKLNDDIEEFSSPEKKFKLCSDNCSSTQTHLNSTKAKFSLMHRGFLRGNTEGTQTASKSVITSGRPPIRTRLDTGNEKVVFPRLTISPIRKINLIDSDSDDSSAVKSKCRNNKEDFKKQILSSEKPLARKLPEIFLANKCQKDNLWKDFSPKNSKIETPALDEFCKEYHANRQTEEMKPSGVLTSNDYSGLNSQTNNFNEKEAPPAYKYFLHADPRIQALIRNRLPHFCPIGVKNDSEPQQFGAENLDYMAQFNQTVSVRKASIASQKVSGSSSSKKKNIKSHCNVVEASDAGGSWVNAKSRAAVPKDAGKRRVSADVRQSGHWLTDQDGRKVYISKDGEKSTGRIAYTKYKKEIGGFRKYKKNAVAKNKQKGRC